MLYVASIVSLCMYILLEHSAKPSARDCNCDMPKLTFQPCDMPELTFLPTRPHASLAFLEAEYLRHQSKAYPLINGSADPGNLPSSKSRILNQYYNKEPRSQCKWSQVTPEPLERLHGTPFCMCLNNNLISEVIRDKGSTMIFKLKSWMTFSGPNRCALPVSLLLTFRS
jgi:hypothetical protein